MGSSELPPARTEAHRKDFSEGGKVCTSISTFFLAVAVLTQIAIQNGEPLFDVEYDG